MSSNNKEIEVRFLDINKDELKEKALALGFTDLGDKLLTEYILYDKDGSWHTNGRLLRIRSDGDTHEMTYKYHHTYAADGAIDITLPIPDPGTAILFLENLDFKLFRTQEKRRHTFKKNALTLDFDTWPDVPTYLEVEGESEEDLKLVAEALGLSWKDHSLLNARDVLEQKYNIPFRDMEIFKFGEKKKRDGK